MQILLKIMRDFCFCQSISSLVLLFKGEDKVHNKQTRPLDLSGQKAGKTDLSSCCFTPLLICITKEFSRKVLCILKASLVAKLMEIKCFLLKF